MSRAAAVLALLAAVLASCARPARKPDELSVWTLRPAPALAPLVRRYEADHPGLRVIVKTLEPAQAGDSVAAALAAGAPPDLCELPSTALPALLASGALLDWSAGVADQRDSLRGWDLCRVGDALYGLPWLIGTRALFYNRELFARARLDPGKPPGTWSELYADAVKIQRLRGGVHGYGLPLGDAGESLGGFLPYAWSSGGEILSANRDSSHFDSPENVAALAFYQKLGGAALVDSQARLESEFLAGRLGLLLGGPGLCDRLGDPAAKARFGVALVPRASAAADEGVSAADGSVLASFVRSRHKEMALRFARYLARPGNALAVAMQTPDLLPATAGADSLPGYRNQPDRRLLLRQCASVRFLPSTPGRDSISQFIADELAEAVHGRKSAAQAIADADARIARQVSRK